jgi:hypothetical protein
MGHLVRREPEDRIGDLARLGPAAGEGAGLRLVIEILARAACCLGMAHVQWRQHQPRADGVGAAAGVVHDHVDSPEGGDGRLDNARRGRLLADILDTRHQRRS